MEILQTSMKRISTSQLAGILEVETKQIFTYHQRGKLNFIKQGRRNFVDLNDPVNEKFILEYTNKRGNVVHVSDIKPEEIAKAKKRSAPVKNVNDKERKPREMQRKVMKPVTEYEQHRTDKMKQDAELARLRLLQVTGKVVPLDQAQMIFAMHFANVATEFYNAVDNYTVIINDKLGGTREDLSKFRAELKKTVNNAIEYAKKKSREQLKAKGAEYAKSRKIETE